MAIIKIARLWSGAHRGRAASAAAAAAVEPDGLDAFGSEEPGPSSSGAKGVLVLAPPPQATAAAAPARLRIETAAVLKWTAVVLLTAGVVGVSMWSWQRRVAARAVGQLTVETTPPGLDVTIAGELKGRTPLTVDLAPGTYAVQVGSGAQIRVLNATLAPGRTLVERLEMAPPVVTGSLHVETEPSGLPVLVDGEKKGSSPLTVEQLTPGDHQIIVAGNGRSVRRSVSVRANETVSLIISAAAVEAPNASGGYLVIASPVVLQLREDGKVIGSTDMDRLMLPAGDHRLELVNEAAGYRAQRSVSIVPGRTARVVMDPPQGRLSINAQPWAEVWLDGKRLGETPLGNVSAPIGSHEIVFRHPEFGERHATVSIGLKEPARVGMDMRKK